MKKVSFANGVEKFEFFHFLLCYFRPLFVLLYIYFSISGYLQRLYEILKGFHSLRSLAFSIEARMEEGYLTNEIIRVHRNKIYLIVFYSPYKRNKKDEVKASNKTAFFLSKRSIIQFLLSEIRLKNFLCECRRP